MVCPSRVPMKGERKLMKSDYEEYKETGMIGAYYPERAILRSYESGVLTTYRDCAHRINDDSYTSERTMVVNGKTYLVTSVFPLESTATPTDKMLSYIDSELAKDAKSA